MKDFFLTVAEWSLLAFGVIQWVLFGVTAVIVVGFVLYGLFIKKMPPER